MDGLSKSDDLVFVLGASNLPWELDAAMLRRLEKRILVDLPTKVSSFPNVIHLLTSAQEAREAMFRHHLPAETVTDEVKSATILTIMSSEHVSGGWRDTSSRH